MELSMKEFKAMNRPFRRWLQRNVEYPLFRKFGCDVEGRDVLEIGCGSGYGAELLMERRPRSYTGIDLMPEQIALAVKRNLPRARFFAHDAARLDFLGSESVDIVFDFGILHHVPEWRKALAECGRVLRRNGELYIVEPDVRLLAFWDKIFHWGHPRGAAFTRGHFDDALAESGFATEGKRSVASFRFYKAVRDRRAADKRGGKSDD